MRNPSFVTVISMWSFNLSKSGTCFMAFSSCCFSWSILSLLTLKLSPTPALSVPVLSALPDGSLKYPATASFTGLLLLSSHKTMNNAIIAVTKSAYATFHAPPWAPPCPPFFLMTMIGAFAAGTGKFPSLSALCCRGRRAALILDKCFCFLERRPNVARNRAPPYFHCHGRRSSLHKRHNHHPQHLVVRVFVVNRLRHVRGQGSDQSVTQ